MSTYEVRGGVEPPLPGDTIHRVSGQKIYVVERDEEVVDGLLEFTINGEFLWHVLVATGATIERAQ